MSDDDHSSVPLSDSDSEQEKIQDLVLSEPQFYVLGQFLETQDGKNIATILQELTKQLEGIRTLLQHVVQKKIEL